MLFVIQLVLAFVVALVLSGVLVLVIDPERRAGGVAAFAGVLAIIWFVTLALGAWLVPFGPMAFGVPWLGFLLIGILLLLVIAAVPATDRRVRVGAGPSGGRPDASTVAFGVVFWMLLGLAAAAVLLRLFYPA